MLIAFVPSNDVHNRPLAEESDSHSNELWSAMQQIPFNTPICSY